MNNSFNVNETYLTNHPGNFTNLLTHDQSFSYLKHDNSFVLGGGAGANDQSFPSQSRAGNVGAGLGGGGIGYSSGLNASASDIQIMQGAHPYINDTSGISHG